LSRTQSVLQDLEQTDIKALMQAAADVLLSVDGDGKIAGVTFASEELQQALNGTLVGRQWADTVTADSRGKLDELLRVTTASGSVVRDLVQRLADGTELPIRYVAAAPFPDGRIVALGRDQRPIAALQQQVLDAQMALEKDYWALRHVETRYRLLFQTASEPLLVVDEGSRRVIEANPLAEKLLGDKKAKAVVGKPFPIGFDPSESKRLRELLVEAAAVGRANADGIRLASGSEQCAATVHLLRQGDEARFLIRLSPRQGSQQPGVGSPAACIDSVMRHAPDAVVLTDTEGRIRTANETFLQIAHLASEEQAIGRSIDRWLGRSGVDLNVLLNNLRQHESVKLFATKLRSEYGTPTDVEISVGTYSDGDDEGFAFFVRDVGRRIASEPSMSTRLPKSVEQITQQVGRVPLKDLVRQSTDLVEQLCIERALELTGDNKASAAELLGVSRQGLYVKLNRYNLADGGAED
jgi:transcriptional regulator PpsR